MSVTFLKDVLTAQGVRKHLPYGPKSYDLNHGCEKAPAMWS